jgi:hypothetical protein
MLLAFISGLFSGEMVIFLLILIWWISHQAKKAATVVKDNPAARNVAIAFLKGWFGK